MTTNDVFLDACKGLVMHCNCNILILNVLGDFRAYIAPEVRLKTRECRYNEVQDAQDITKLILNLGHNFAQGMNEQTLREKVQSVHKESFKFGTDDYVTIYKDFMKYQRNPQTNLQIRIIKKKSLRGRKDFQCRYVYQYLNNSPL